MAQHNTLQVDHVSLFYPGHALRDAALHDVSLSIAPHELLVALGPSGCGKTSLLNLIAGFILPSKGGIALNGKPVKGPGSERGVVFQDDALLPWLNVADNIAFGLQLKGVAKEIQREAVQRLLLQVGLQGYGEHSVWQLSGGMRQRVGLARALAADPEVLLMDEPFGALDALTREQMQRLLLQIWRDTGKRILLISHDVEEAILLATELLLMSPRPGRIVERIALSFGRRHAAGESLRAIKADPQFIATREHILEQIFAQHTAVLQE